MSNQTKTWHIHTDKQKAAAQKVFDHCENAYKELEKAYPVMPFFTECPIYRKHLAAINALEKLKEAIIAEEERADNFFLK